MALHYNGITVGINPFILRDNIVRLSSNRVVMHPYTAACLMLETTAFEYKCVFKELGVIDEAVDACVDSILKIINLKIDSYDNSRLY